MKFDGSLALRGVHGLDGSSAFALSFFYISALHREDLTIMGTCAVN